MKKVIWWMLFTVCAAAVAAACAVGIYDELAGSPRADALLATLHIPLRSGQILLIGLACTGAMLLLNVYRHRCWQGNTFSS